jgi:uncharacterized protein YprB with RNaseH-like and TPR domain
VKIAVFDLETTALIGDLGRLLCASVLSLPEDNMITFRQDEVKKKKSMADDREICVQVRDYLESHHMTIGYYSKGFDIPFLNTRLAAHDERHLMPMLHLDPIWFFKGWRGLKPRSSKLKVVAEFLELEPKPDVPVEVWVNAQGGDKEAIDILVDRCEADTRITKEVAEFALRAGLVRNIQRYP